MNNKHEEQNQEELNKRGFGNLSSEEQKIPNPNKNYYDNKTNNSFEATNNVIHNDSQTILSDENNFNNYANSKYNNNYINNNKGFIKSNSDYSNKAANNYNFNKIKQKTIETVLENECEENCSYNQISGNREGENDPIVTFIFYKEEGIDLIEDNLQEKNYDKTSQIENEEKSISLNLNNIKQKNNNEDNNFGNLNNNNANFNINDIIDNISQSEIFGKNEKSGVSNDNLNPNKIDKQSNNNLNNLNNKNENDNKQDNSDKADKSDNNQTVKYDVLFSEILEACPIIQLSADTSKNIIVKMPRWITIHDFKTYLSIIKHGIEFNSVFTFNKLLLLSDFFENNDFVEKLVKDHIVPNFDYSNVIDYLENAYLKLSSSKENSLPVNISWFELFIKAIDFVSKNFVFYLNSENSEFFDKLSKLNKKILEELLDKSIEQIISNPFIFDDEILLDNDILNNISQSNLCENFKFIRHEIFEKLIEFLHNLRNTKNIFDLLMNEYLRISSDEIVAEVNNLPNPTLSIDIPIEANNYYKEFTLDLNIYNRMLVFIVYYKKSDDSLNVSFKLNNYIDQDNDNDNEDNKDSNKGSYWDMLGSFGNIIGGSNSYNANSNKNNFGNSKNKKLENSSNNFKNNNYNKNINKAFADQNNLINSNHIDYKKNKDLNLNKFTSFKILSFLCVVSLNEEKSKTQINTNIIPNDYNKSAYPIYKITNFTKYVDDLIIAQNEDMRNFPSSFKDGKLKKEKQIKQQALAVNDEINLNEECEDICQTINWENVSTELTLEFMMKYPKIIKNCKLEKIFEQSLQINLLNLLHSQNRFINNAFNLNNNQQSSNNVLNHNQRLIEESVFGTVSHLFKSLLKVGNNMNYTNNYVQIQKYSRLNSVNFGNFTYKSHNRMYSRDSPNYSNTEGNNEFNNNFDNINSRNSYFKQQKTSDRNIKKQGNITSGRSLSKQDRKIDNRFHSKSTEPNQNHKFDYNTEAELYDNQVNKNLNKHQNKKDNNILNISEQNKDSYSIEENKNEKKIDNKNNKKIIEDLNSSKNKNENIKKPNNLICKENEAVDYQNLKKEVENLDKNSKYSFPAEFIHQYSNKQLKDNSYNKTKAFEPLDEKENKQIINKLNEEKIEEINSLNLENDEIKLKLSNKFSDDNCKLFKESAINDFYSVTNIINKQDLLTKNSLKLEESYKKINSIESKMNKFDSEYSYFSANCVKDKSLNNNNDISKSKNSTFSKKPLENIISVNPTINMKISQKENDVSNCNKQNIYNNKVNNLQSIIDEERTLEVNHLNEEKNVFSTFNNAIQIFNNEDYITNNYDNEQTYPNDQYRKTEDNYPNKNDNSKGKSFQHNFGILKEFTKKEKNQNIVNSNDSSVMQNNRYEKYKGINTKSKSSLEKTNPNMKNISKSKTSNLNIRSLTPNFDSTNCNSNTNNMINSSYNSNSFSKNLGNFINNQNLNSNNNLNNQNACNPGANSNKLINTKELTQINSKNKPNSINQKKFNYVNTENQLNCDFKKIEGELLKANQEKENLEKFYLKTENSNACAFNSMTSVHNSINNKQTNFSAFNNAFNSKTKNSVGDSNTSANISTFLKNRVERKQFNIKTVNNSINNSVNYPSGNFKKMNNNNNNSLLEYSNNNNYLNTHMNTTNTFNLSTNKDMINNSVAGNLNNFIESKKTKNSLGNNYNSSNTNNNISFNFNTSSESNIVLNAKNTYNYMNSNSKGKIRENSNKRPTMISLLKSNSSMQMGSSVDNKDTDVSRNINKNRITTNNSNVNSIHNYSNKTNCNNPITSSEALLNFFNKRPSGSNTNVAMVNFNNTNKYSKK